MLEFVNFYLIPGIILGSIYALCAVGVSLIFGILRFAHFAHGDMMTVGAYLALTAVVAVGISPFLALPIAIAGTVGVGLAMDRVFYRPLRARPTIIVVIASFGVALMLRAGVQLIWGSKITSYVTGIQRPLVFFDTIRIAERHIWIILLTVLLVVALHLFLTRTRSGKAMRAVADDPELARVSGIHTEAVVRNVWILGAGLAAVAGVFVGIDTQLNPNMGWDLLLPVFAAALVGGIGRPYGAIAGGYIIGLAEELATYPWIGDQALVSPGYKTAIAFILMVIVLIFRPRGLFKGSQF